MPQTMCWDSVCTVAEVWCCSEHYLWPFDGSLSRGGLTRCQGVLDHGLKLLGISL